MNCAYCSGKCRKRGFQTNGTQRYRCSQCNKYQQQTYRNMAWLPHINADVVRFLREGVGIRGIGRLSGISPKTVLARIKTIAAGIKEPPLPMGKTYEVDELRTYVGHKGREVWVVCAYERETKRILRFSVGRRTNKTLKLVLDSLQTSNAAAIHTDGLKYYKYLIDKNIHKVKRYGTNRIERAHLTLRTRLKRLSRRGICFSKSAYLLWCCMRVCLWA